MSDELQVLLNLSAALTLALVGGALAVRLRQSPLIGYLLAGIIIGPFTPGFVGDTHRIASLAGVGIIFLMFTLGVEFSLEELARVRRIALLGTALQLIGTGALGAVLGLLLGWSGSAAIYLGALVALSSTVVIIKTLQARGEVDSTHGRVLLGMLIVQDLAAVALLVILPALTSNAGSLLPTLALALGKSILFIGGTLVLGKRVVPWLVHAVARLASEELFILAVAALALGAALGATALGLSTALGAFLAGLLVGTSDVEHRAMAEIIPLRDLFSSLFFVSVGMLIDPSYVATHPLLVIGVAAAVLLLKSVIATAVVLLPTFHLSSKTALFVGLALAQIGEFSFVLARQGVDQHVLSASQYSLILTTSVLTLILTPSLFWVVPRLDLALARVPGVGPVFRPRVVDMFSGQETADGWQDHVIVVGCGQVGSRVALALHAQGMPVVGIDQDLTSVEALRAQGVPILYGDASYRAVLEAAQPERARALVVALPDFGAARVVVLNARIARPDINIVVRARDPRTAALLRQAGAHEAVEPELEGGLELLRITLGSLSVSTGEQERVLAHARADAQTAVAAHELDIQPDQAEYQEPVAAPDSASGHDDTVAPPDTSVEDPARQTDKSDVLREQDEAAR
ncbi:MAG: putative monovalent cation:proton antiporter family [Chloroflexi bacterium]|nr:putative monovalent cation:proton antiporter family [Chloroflexota bacterium]